ncbi:MAG TPA: hypothetical protein VGS23_00875 [Thermoplasmata archaeon]|nr:hypothetical protein [Thermoplasmata archaeon]
MAEGYREERPEDGPRQLVLYDVAVTFPLVTGAAAALGGLALTVGAAHRVTGLDLAYFLAVAMIVGGVIAYLVLGMWLLPVSMVVGGCVLFSANQILLYLPSWAPLLAIPYWALGAVGLIGGTARSYPRCGSDR